MLDLERVFLDREWVWKLGSNENPRTLMLYPLLTIHISFGI